MRNFKLITASVLAILVAIVVVQNRQRVATHLLFATVVMPHAILLFIASAAGFALALIADIFAYPPIRLSTRIRPFPEKVSIGPERRHNNTGWGLDQMKWKWIAVAATSSFAAWKEISRRHTQKQQ
jgi:uncharacterized integral membrane protein